MHFCNALNHLPSFSLCPAMDDSARCSVEGKALFCPEGDCRIGLYCGILWVSQKLMKDAPPRQGDRRRPGMLKLTHMGWHLPAIGKGSRRISKNEV